jgi:hypothetical protein
MPFQSLREYRMDRKKGYKIKTENKMTAGATNSVKVIFFLSFFIDLFFT